MPDTILAVFYSFAPLKRCSRGKYIRGIFSTIRMPDTGRYLRDSEIYHKVYDSFKQAVDLVR
jgi:hypothetical protein